MGFFLSNLLFALLSAVFGVVLGWFVADPDRVPEWLAARRRDWSGRWWCIWQHPDEPNRLVVDEVRFSRAFGTIKFSLVEPGDEFQWEGRGKIASNYFVGEFRSMRPRSTVRGTFTFALLPQGDRLVGYFNGPTTTGGLVANAGLFTTNAELAARVRRGADVERREIFQAALRPAFSVDHESAG